MVSLFDTASRTVLSGSDFFCELTKGTTFPGQEVVFGVRQYHEVVLWDRRRRAEYIGRSDGAVDQCPNRCRTAAVAYGDEIVRLISRPYLAFSPGRP